MSQAKSSTNVARVAVVAKPPDADPVAVVAKPLDSQVAAVAKRPTDPAPLVSTGPPVHPAVWGIGFIAFALLFFGGVYIGQDFLVDRPHNAGLYIDPKYLDFGEVWAEEAFKWRVPIQNKSDRAIAEITIHKSHSSRWKDEARVPVAGFRRYPSDTRFGDVAHRTSRLKFRCGQLLQAAQVRMGDHL